MANATFTKIADAQPMGQYAATTVDANKTSVDFLVVQTSPYFISWKNGEIQKVTSAQLKKLQLSHTWATDF